MKVGLIARAEDRGLGIQSWEAARHLDLERVLVVDVQNREGFDMYPDRYPGATVVTLDPHAGLLPERPVREWLDGLDVVLSMETLYDWRVADWARQEGAGTAVQVNPEFYLHGVHPELPRPTAWWNPSTWRMDSIPGARHIPVPVALDRFAKPAGQDVAARSNPVPLRVLHVVGRPAVGDRNGTEILAMAARMLPTGLVDITVSTQAQPRNYRGMTTRAAVGDYWDLYDGFDVLVMPRRFGGLCLPVQEAMAAGLAVVMPGCSPNKEMWPIVPVDWHQRGQIDVPCGQVPMVETDARALARVLTALAQDELMLYAAKAAARAWASTHSWGALLPMYEAELALVADGARVA